MDSQESIVVGTPSETTPDATLETPSETTPDTIDELIANELISGKLQKCPGGCIVEKIDGCNFVDCKCGRKFCWNCKREKGPAGDQCAYGNAVCNSH